jgi:hypothetical protein
MLKQSRPRFGSLCAPITHSSVPGRRASIADEMREEYRRRRVLGMPQNVFCDESRTGRTRLSQTLVRKASSGRRSRRRPLRFQPC